MSAVVAQPISPMLTAVVVIAASGVVATVVTAWLIYQIGRKAIDKATPEGVPSVILALSALIHPLRTLLPWREPGRVSQPSPRASDLLPALPQEENQPTFPEEGQA